MRVSTPAEGPSYLMDEFSCDWDPSKCHEGSHHICLVHYSYPQQLTLSPAHIKDLTSYLLGQIPVSTTDK